MLLGGAWTKRFCNKLTVAKCVIQTIVCHNCFSQYALAGRGHSFVDKVPLPFSTSKRFLFFQAYYALGSRYLGLLCWSKMAPYVSIKLCIGRGGAAGKRQRCGKITASWHWPPQWHKCCLQQTHLKLAVSRIVVFFHASRRFGAVKHIRKKNALTGGILSTRSCDGVFLRSFLFCGTHGRLLWDVHWVGQTDPCECLWRYIESKFSQRAGFDDMCALRAWRDPCANRNGGMAHTRIYASQITRYANTNNN